MKTITKTLVAAFLAGTSASALAASPDARLQALQDQITALSKQIDDIKADAQKQDAALKAQQDEAKAREADAKKAAATAKSVAKPGIANGRLSIASSDGDFSASIRSLLQTDFGYYMQGGGAKSLPTAYGPDLSSGVNLRRVFLGLQGKVFGDWSYYFLYDFGGPSVEQQGHILYAYLQFDGFAPWAIKVGAYAPPINIEDSTASADLLFFERNSPSNLQRNIAGAEGRDAISVIYAGERLFGAVSLTGNKVQDGSKALAAAGATATPNYDEQAAVAGRIAYMPISTADAHWIIGVNGLHVFKLPDLVPTGANNLSNTPGLTARSTYSLADLPEFSVDSNGTQLVSTGAMAAGHVTSWGLETAGNYQNFYGQAGYYSYAVKRSPIAYNVYSAASTFAAQTVQPSDNTFSGWYVQGSWVLTGESHVYNAASASFGAPKPAKNFSLKDGTWGAFELAARFSDLDLNSHTGNTDNVVSAWTGTSKTYTYYNTVRGGEQKIVTVALNWYLNPAIRMALQYQYIDVSRLQTPAAVTTTGTPTLPALKGGQKLNTLGMRFQLSI
ncbi:porin [Rhizomicrobium electricum]|jgi:phosphate-selective porin OprO/OprP|uniref:OprO/OprP family phosphate-selective porin n=1 Tax=Rhizomicrobium electricum TaxID=480070 RepID=A0ABN1E6Y3_9PROT|nr:porin [Rhizomicrobium electricum]NIJ47825.1 phosphate-selective porin OprO/OprP [Rhizomicrobium electricum]